MKGVKSIITVLRTVIKYASIIFIVIEVVEFAINKFTDLDKKLEGKNAGGAGGNEA